MPKTAVYIRVSHDSQTHDSQRIDIEKWLAAHPMPNVVWYVDTMSGRTLDRPAWRKLRDAVEHGEVDTVVCQRYDRLSRKLVDGLTIMADMLERGVRVVAVMQQMDISGPAGKLVASVFLAVAEWETETRRERQRSGIDAAMAADKKLPVEQRKYQGARRRKRRYKADLKAAADYRDMGLSVKQIGKVLGVGETTARNYLKICTSIQNSLDGSP